VPRVESESQFVWRQLISILKFPFLLLLFLIGRKPFSEVMAPFSNLFRFLFEPVATVLLAASIFGVFVYQLFFMPQEVFNSLVFQPADLFALNLTPLVASWFLHASWTHLLGNMLFLYVFGRIVERRLGSLRLVVIYFGSAIISSVIAALAGQGGIGASGALAGLISTAISSLEFLSLCSL
jgi:membrane associated rhomboid family serine protease